MEDKSPFVRATNGSELWREYAKDPDRHPLIPNCSFAGYRRGEAPLPNVPTIVDAREFGSVGDGRTDDTAAVQQALHAASLAGGGAVFLDEGRYLISGVLHLKDSGVVLRGAGRGHTQLVFTRSLTDILGSSTFHEEPKRSIYGWAGGLIWISPTMKPGPTNWEAWPAGQPLGTLAAPARAGDRDLELTSDTAAALRTQGIDAGTTIMMTWTDPGDRSFLEHIAGHESMRAFDWDTFGTMLLGRRPWRWQVEIAALDKTHLTLAQPLRVDADPRWNIQLERLPDHVSEVGVEHLTITMLNTERTDVHLQDVGFNGIYLNRALHCWVRDVEIQNAQNGIIVAASKNTTTRDFTISGRRHHHATALRMASHDNLVAGFVIDAPPLHGINTEGLSSGNVWHNGTMLHGTFDSHRQMSFDSLRTDITVHNDGRPGGSRTAGPFLGKRVVHWNIRLSGVSEYIYQPDGISNGALVGISGLPMSTAPIGHSMVEGFKGCAIADEGQVPDPPDLYLAQMESRNSDGVRRTEQ